MSLFRNKKPLSEMSDKELEREVRRKELRFGESIATRAKTIMEADKRGLKWKDSDLRYKK